MSTKHEYKLPESRFGLGSDHTDLIVFLIRYSRISCLVFIAWSIGYLNFSFAWILVFVFLYLLREKTSSARQIKSEMVRSIGINEKDAILARLDEVPGWVFFPDKERVEWLNKILKLIWPNFRVYLTKTLVDVVEPIINQYSTGFVGSVKFVDVDLGDIPPRIASIKTYTENVPLGEIMFDCEIMYAGDANIKLSAKKITAGVKDLQFHGDLRVILKPLCDRMPFFATATIFFLKMPQIDFNLTDVANTFDMPGLRKLIDSTIDDSICKTLVLPNRLVIPIISDFNISELDYMKTIKPKGVLRVHVIKGINLKKADIGVFGGGKSDPYLKISGLGVPKATKVVQNNLNPVWNETFNFLIDDDVVLSPNILIQCFDKDELNDDFLGSVDINVDNIITKGREEGIYKLKGVQQGELLLQFEWFTVSSDKSKLDLIQNYKSLKQQQATSLLIVDLRSANDLPIVYKRNGIGEPNPRVYMSVKDDIRTSATKQRTTCPKWNENFFFFIENPSTESLFCKIEDQKSKQTISNLEVCLKDLLNEENLKIDREFNLNTFLTDYKPKLNLRLTLYILCPAFDKSQTVDPSLEHSPSIQTRITRHSDSSTSKYNFGQIKLSMRYSIEEGLFIMTIHECRNLCQVHHANLPDPYIKVMLIPDKKSKKKLRSIKDTLNPTFNEIIQWNIGLNDLKRRQLCLTVKNDKSLLANEKSFMGQVMLDLTNMDREGVKEKWFELRDKKEARFFVDYCEDIFDRLVTT